MKYTLKVQTHSQTEFIDITKEVDGIIKKSNGNLR